MGAIAQFTHSSPLVSDAAAASLEPSVMPYPLVPFSTVVSSSGHQQVRYGV